ncbi:MAG: nucleotidyl transferase AbiEii/AbiGii toxin family protein [Anaerolineaceae bacterium]|nr:nucleotidyl transferase AbiEii/AbiGii toxin family protein [Anaerolineaceae bacterium]
MSLDPAKHKTILVRILKDIFTDPQVGPILGFKGGTAAYLFYDLDRFSVDLDFDLLDNLKVDNVFEKVKDLLQKYGRIKIADKKRYSLIYILVYDDKEPEAQNVKIEINLRDFGSRYNIKTYLGISMKVMIPEDMAANKLVAFYERIGKTNRDVYDTWFFFNHGWKVNQELVERRTGMPYKEFLETCCTVLEKLNNRQILSGMGEVLNEKQKNWVKSHLKDELLFLLKLSLENQR